MQTRAARKVDELKNWSPDGVVEHKLTSREKMRKIIELRYLEGMTLEQVGEILGVTRERVRQLEAKALRILRANPENREKGLSALRGVNEIRR
jgi:DNA-directed RNA polymerase sigma subunit (sigma70/sigma32)